MREVKTPFAYSGGKSRLAPWIIKHFPGDYQNNAYVEPFAGGLAVLFRKKKSKVEVINDLDLDIYNFFSQLRDNPDELYRRCVNTPCGKAEWREAQNILAFGANFPNVARAWAFYVATMTSFRCNRRSHTFDLKKTVTQIDKGSTAVAPRRLRNKTENFFPASKRIRDCYILNEPALDIIEKMDSPDALFYLDPPYPESSQTQYKYKFDQKDFEELLEVLKGIKGKFLLSFYERNWMLMPKEWHLVKKDVRLLEGLDQTKWRTECLAMNYKPGQGQKELF